MLYGIVVIVVLVLVGLYLLWNPLLNLLFFILSWIRVGVLQFFIRVISVVFLAPCLILLGLYELWMYFRQNHKLNSEIGSNIAKASRVVAGFGGLWAWLIAPSGSAALFTSLGIGSTPLIITLSPILIAFAGAAYTISAFLDLYSKHREKREKRNLG